MKVLKDILVQVLLCHCFTSTCTCKGP